MTSTDLLHPPLDRGADPTGAPVDGTAAWWAPGAATPPPAVEPTVDDVGPAAPRRSWAVRAVRGRPDDPVWVRPALLALLAGTLALYTWHLSESGYANSFYSAAAQAGSVSWKAFLFGSSDAANSITVDKPPLSLWPQSLAIRVFGLNSWSILLPQALMGVASVGVLYRTVRRWFGPAAGLLAGLVLALTPVATLMFRFNNPDAALTLLMILATACALRGMEDGRTRWTVLTGVFVGLGFLAKQLQVLLIVPPLALTHLALGQGRFARRLRDLALAGVAMVVSAGWWIALVELWPKSSRPYVGGSQTNSILELTFGYNGFGRLTGDETGSVGGGGNGGTGMWGRTGITRLFDGNIGGQIAWLAPAALALAVAGLWLTRRAPRTDPQRAAIVAWLGWLVVTGLTFSYMGGIFHEYYTVALAPAIGALVGIGSVLLRRRRHHPVALLFGAATILGTGIWSAELLHRSDGWKPWIATSVLVGAFVAAAGLAVAALPMLPAALTRRLAIGGAAVAIVVGLAGPTAWSLETASVGHRGSIVTAGPAVASDRFGGFGRRGGGGFPGGGFPGGTQTGGRPTTGNGPGGFTPPAGGFPGGGLPGGAPGGTTTGGSTTNPFGGTGGGNLLGRLGGGGMGGLLEGATVSDEAKAALLDDADRYTWVAATTGSQNASSYQLATERPVMAIGGFNGSDPSPTLAEFQQDVAAGKIHWYIASGLSGGRSMNGSNAAAEIASWVEANYTATTVGTATFYDLTAPTS